MNRTLKLHLLLTAGFYIGGAFVCWCWNWIMIFVDRGSVSDRLFLLFAFLLLHFLMWNYMPEPKKKPYDIDTMSYNDLMALHVRVRDKLKAIEAATARTIFGGSNNYKNGIDEQRKD